MIHQRLLLLKKISQLFFFLESLPLKVRHGNGVQNLSTYPVCWTSVLDSVVLGEDVPLVLPPIIVVDLLEDVFMLGLRLDAVSACDVGDEGVVLLVLQTRHPVGWPAARRAHVGLWIDNMKRLRI